MVATTTPTDDLTAVAASRPSRAPHPARIAPCHSRREEYSNTAAPTNEPRKAPITLPTTGTGTPSRAPTIPPRIAPHAARAPPP
jgi:hypothetical protein